MFRSVPIFACGKACGLFIRRKAGGRVTVLSVEKLAGGLPFYPSKSLRAGYFFIREGARPDHFLKVALK